MQVAGVSWIAEQQDVLYAQDRWALLLVFQAMDAAGKDGTIKHLASGINPQGCEVTSFKQPSAEELDHDYLWRHMQHVPARGQIGIFNRSYYEEVLVVKVHPEMLAHEKLPPSLVTNDIWNERYEDIASFERYLTRNGVRILKFFLHVSKEEQKRRFLERLDEPEKNWKFQSGDVAERAHWDEYHAAYEEAIRNTASKARAVVRRSGRQQVVHAPRRVERGDQSDCRSGTDVPEDQRRREDGTGRRACAARGGVTLAQVCFSTMLTLSPAP